MNKEIKIIASALMVLACGCSNIKTEYVGFSPSAAMSLVKQDALSYLKGSNLTLSFRLDSAITDGRFGYELDGRRVIFHGGDEIGLSEAFYTLLEDMGYTFDFTGVSRPVRTIDISELKAKEIVPRVRWRGVRQHLNFPMDISSYSIEDAKDYLENLFRMRFNKITFHSYPGQWYETHVDDSLVLAGNFFYGFTHYMYENELLRENVHGNDSIFCIPEAESLYKDPEARSRFAVKWLQELVDYAADLGFYVQFSFEPRLNSVDQTVSTAKEIAKSYPRIDALEMITEETGGWGPACTAEDVEMALDKYFTSDVAANKEVQEPIRPRQSDLANLYSEIGIIANAVEILQKDRSFTPELKLGIYSSVTPYTKGAYRLARLALPQYKICLMSSHGSKGTADALEELIRTKDDLKQTEIYSWIEFDGLMYLYQNSVAGNERVMRHIENLLQGDQCESLLFNHWRTAENRTSARYVAEATIDGALSAKDFFERYALRLGIKDVPEYLEAMSQLQQADDFATNHLGNIGFCWEGAWRHGGCFRWISRERAQEDIRYYAKADSLLSVLTSMTDSTTAAYDYLTFILNRVKSSEIYLDAFYTASEMRLVPKGDQAEAERIYHQAISKYEEYISEYSLMMPDRGCEGTIVSVWNAPVRGLKSYFFDLCGVRPEDLPEDGASVDAPPLPIKSDE
jgi:hypothetical protein